ncbi:hypothetical protein [Zhongshania borealis]|uniref:Uncharacterized protein n=1 Tax=Zhongshania borealis TaxID=889488 RepID=A0ABP7X6Z1_9GAMM
MLGFLKMKRRKDEYLRRVVPILQKNIGPGFNAYSLAEECLGELRGNISSGMFHDGPNPKENIMAFYSICSMISETSSADDRATILKLSVMAGVLKEKLGPFENMTSLEKGIFHYGEQVLAGGIGAPSESSIEKLKSYSVQVIMDLMKDQDADVLEHDVKQIVDNVSTNVGDREVLKVGSQILAVSVLSNATGYYIDQGESNIAHSYFKCVSAAINKYFDGQMESYNDYQKNALRVIINSHRSLGKELMKD